MSYRISWHEWEWEKKAPVDGPSDYSLGEPWYSYSTDDPTVAEKELVLLWEEMREFVKRMFSEDEGYDYQKHLQGCLTLVEEAIRDRKPYTVYMAHNALHLEPE